MLLNKEDGGRQLPVDIYIPQGRCQEIHSLLGLQCICSSASGFSSLLLSNYMKEPFNDYTNLLPNNKFTVDVTDTASPK